MTRAKSSCGMDYAVVLVMKIKVAIPLWKNRISPVLETASILLISEIEDNVESSRHIVSIPSSNYQNRVKYFQGKDIDVLICGALSNETEMLLSVTGIELIPWIGGEVDDVISAYSQGEIISNNFLLPGCKRGHRRGRRGGRGRRGRNQR